MTSFEHQHHKLEYFALIHLSLTTHLSLFPVFFVSNVMFTTFNADKAISKTYLITIKTNVYELVYFTCSCFFLIRQNDSTTVRLLSQPVLAKTKRRAFSSRKHILLVNECAAGFVVGLRVVVLLCSIWHGQQHHSF